MENPGINPPIYYSGSAVEVRREFLALLEDSISKTNISASLERFSASSSTSKSKIRFSHISRDVTSSCEDGDKHSKQDWL